MASEYFITMDTHCRTTDICVKTALGKQVRSERVATAIPQLLDVIQKVPRPRRIAFEEGPLAGWLYRNLAAHADEVVVCDPRRNALVAKDGDKDDPIDAAKLNDLYRGGFLRQVHQSASAEKAAFKQLVNAYHQRVAHRVSEANTLMGLGKRWGLLLSRSMLNEGQAVKQIQERFSQGGAPGNIVEVAGMLAESHQSAAEQEEKLHQRVVELSKSDELYGRLMELPGYGPVRCVTLVAYLDTPFRFKSREAVWKYVGIGLRRERSGEGMNFVRVEQQCNHLLRNVSIGAARSAIAAKKNVFARRYARWVQQGVSPRNARRNVARLQISTAWAMWKSGQAFAPELIWAEGDDLE
jgi:transposase